MRDRCERSGCAAEGYTEPLLFMRGRAATGRISGAGRRRLGGLTWVQCLTLPAFVTASRGQRREPSTVTTDSGCAHFFHKISQDRLQRARRRFMASTIFITGVLGCGKSTVGLRLRERYFPGADFIEGDDYHPESSRAKVLRISNPPWNALRHPLPAPPSATFMGPCSSLPSPAARPRHPARRRRPLAVARLARRRRVWLAPGHRHVLCT